MAKDNPKMPMPPLPPPKPKAFPEEPRTDLDLLLGRRAAPFMPKVSIPEASRPYAARTAEPPARKFERQELRPSTKFSEAEETSPVFIKIEKYTEIVKSLHDLKSYALGLRDALDALADVEKEIRNGLDISQRALDRFNQAIAVLDSKLVKLKGADSAPDMPEEIDGYIKGLYGQVEKLKQELRTADSEL
jgi:hypothetical protein